MKENIATRMVDAFGGLAKTKRALGHRFGTTINAWRRTGKIPPWRYAEINAAARRLDVTLPLELITDDSP